MVNQYKNTDASLVLRSGYTNGVLIAAQRPAVCTQLHRLFHTAKNNWGKHWILVIVWSFWQDEAKFSDIENWHKKADLLQKYQRWKNWNGSNQESRAGSLFWGLLYMLMTLAQKYNNVCREKIRPQRRDRTKEGEMQMTDFSRWEKTASLSAVSSVSN